jgi:murein L,D-transpeptidase YcbB/YkuD
MYVAKSVFRGDCGCIIDFFKRLCYFWEEERIRDPGIKGQVAALEAQLENKDREIIVLREDLDRVIQERLVSVKERVSVEPKSRPNAKQIQTALDNAGYNLGKIDGRIGKQTREAIRSFQRANNLVADGKVGKKTWELLRNYLEKKAK